MTTKPKLIEIPLEVPELWVMNAVDAAIDVYGNRLDPRNPWVWIDTLEKYPKPNVYMVMQFHFRDVKNQWKPTPPSLKQVVADLDKHGFAEYLWASRQVASEAQKRCGHSGPATADEAWDIGTESLLIAGLITLEQAEKMMKKRSH